MNAYKILSNYGNAYLPNEIIEAGCRVKDWSDITIKINDVDYITGTCLAKCINKDKDNFIYGVDFEIKLENNEVTGIIFNNIELEDWCH